MALRFGLTRFARALQQWDPDDRWFPACLGMAGISLYVGLFLWTLLTETSFSTMALGAGLAGGAVGLLCLKRSYDLDYEDKCLERYLRESKRVF